MMSCDVGVQWIAQMACVLSHRQTPKEFWHVSTSCLKNTQSSLSSLSLRDVPVTTFSCFYTDLNWSHCWELLHLCIPNPPTFTSRYLELPPLLVTVYLYQSFGQTKRACSIFCSPSCLSKTTVLHGKKRNLSKTVRATITSNIWSVGCRWSCEVLSCHLKCPEVDDLRCELEVHIQKKNQKICTSIPGINLKTQFHSKVIQKNVCMTLFQQ